MEMLKEQDEIIVVKGISLSHIKFTIVGSTPLVVNRFKTEDIDLDEGPLRGQKAKFEEQYQKSMYINDDESHGFPSAGIKQGMVRAGTYTNNKKLNMKFLSGAFFVTGECNYGERLKLEIKEDPNRRIDIVGLGNKGKKPVCRAEYKEWETTFFVEFNDRIIDKQTIGELVAIAGYHCGLGEMRPEKTAHNFGKYNIKGKRIAVKHVEL